MTLNIYLFEVEGCAQGSTFIFLLAHLAFLGVCFAQQASMEFVLYCCKRRNCFAGPSPAAWPLRDNLKRLLACTFHRGPLTDHDDSKRGLLPHGSTYYRSVPCWTQQPHAVSSVTHLLLVPCLVRVAGQSILVERLRSWTAFIFTETYMVALARGGRGVNQLSLNPRIRCVFLFALVLFPLTWYYFRSSSVRHDMSRTEDCAHPSGRTTYSTYVYTVLTCSVHSQYTHTMRT